MAADLTLAALEQALWVRQVKGKLVRHSDRGGQYLCIRYSKRLATEDIEASVGSVGDAYDDAWVDGLVQQQKANRTNRRKSTLRVRTSAP